MNELKKEIGDLVQINSGTHKDKTGTLVEKGKGWTVELTDSKERISVSFPMVILIQKAQPAAQCVEVPAQETTPQAESTETAQSATETVVEEAAPAETLEVETTQQSVESTTEEVTGEAVSERPAEETPGAETNSTEQTMVTTAEQENPAEIDPEIKKLTINQLQALAKERGVSIARTKADFLRIIKAKNPEEDLNLLKGKILFDRVTELKISRLRSKLDLQILLSK